MKMQHVLPMLSAIALFGAIATPAPVAAQTYECTTTTETRIRTTTYSDGTVIITTIIVKSTVCVPI